MIKREGYVVLSENELTVAERKNLFNGIAPEEIAKRINIDNLHYYRMGNGESLWFGRLDKRSNELLMGLQNYMSTKDFMKENLHIF